MFLKKLKIGNRLIGRHQPVFIVAELSGNHLQKYDLAIKTLKEIKKAGADAVKLQTYSADSITLDPQTITLKNPHKYFKKKSAGIWKGKTSYELFQQACTPWEWQPKLKKFAESLGLICFSSPFDYQAVEFCAKLKMPAYKVASPEITDIPLIEHMASKGKPMIISTGIAKLNEIEEAIEACRRMNNNKIVLLKCSAAYPTPLEEINLRTIASLNKIFGTIVGLSDHSLTISIPIAAVVLGAKIIEKHFIIKRSLGGPDAAFSLEGNEFQQMVKVIREVEKSLGNGVYQLTGKTKKERACARSLFVSNDINIGEQFRLSNIRSIRPADGLHTRYLKEILGKKARKNIKKGTPLEWDLID